MGSGTGTVVGQLDVEEEAAAQSMEVEEVAAPQLEEDAAQSLEVEEVAPQSLAVEEEGVNCFQGS